MITLSFGNSITINIKCQLTKLVMIFCKLLNQNYKYIRSASHNSQQINQLVIHRCNFLLQIYKTHRISKLSQIIMQKVPCRIWHCILARHTSFPSTSNFFSVHMPVNTVSRSRPHCS
jgi:hypothetical protein